MGVPPLIIEMDDAGISARDASGKSPANRVPWEGPEGLDEALAGLAGNLEGFRQAVLLVPDAWVCFRYLHLPFAQKKKLSQILPMEIGPALPDPDQPVVFDFKVLNAGRVPEKHLVLVAAIYRERMEGLFTGLDRYGIRPALVAPSGMARALAFGEEKQAPRSFFYVDIAGGETTHVLVWEGEPLAVRSLRCPDPSAEMSERSAPLALEILRTCAVAGIRGGLDREVLSGIPVVVGAREPGIEGLTAEAVQRDLARLDAPMKVVPADSPGYPSSTDDPALLVDFCTGPFKHRGFSGQYRWHLALCAGLAVLALCLGGAGMFRKNAVLEAEIDRVRQESVAVYRQTFPDAGAAPVQAPLLRMESRVRQAREASGSLPVLAPGADIRVMALLGDLSSRIPADIDVTLTRLVLNNDKLILTGTTGNFNDVDRIKGLIQSSPEFRQVGIASAEADKKEDQVRFKFMVEI